MVIKEIENKIEWEGFLEKCGQKSFLDSWEWGEFQIGQGYKIKRFGLVENSALIAVVLAVKIKARRGTYILIQHGPNIIEYRMSENKKILRELFFELVKWGKSEGAIFIRVATLLERNTDNTSLFKDLSADGFEFTDSPMHANAYEATWKLDITPPEEDLLKAMRKTTRYLIRQAQKNPDIKIEKSDRAEDIEIYQRLNRSVGKRQKFAAFPDGYIKREFKIFSKDNGILMIFGKYRNEVAAGAMVVFWQGAAYYHQAASLAQFAKYSIPYLLQWEAIKEAKARGCKLYDFWGYIDPKKNPSHPWAGPTLFKMGFGGRAFEYVLTQDCVLSPLYWPVWLFEKLRRVKRGL